MDKNEAQAEDQRAAWLGTAVVIFRVVILKILPSCYGLHFSVSTTEKRQIREHLLYAYLVRCGLEERNLNWK